MPSGEIHGTVQGQSMSIQDFTFNLEAGPAAIGKMLLLMLPIQIDIQEIFHSSAFPHHGLSTKKESPRLMLFP